METDKLKVGESLEPLVFTVTPQLNAQVLEALSVQNKRYQESVHPSFLIGFSNITRSPSYRVENGAAVHTHDEIEFLSEARVGETLTVTWEVTALYQRRSRKWQDVIYQDMEAKIVNENGREIIKRRITDIFSRKQNL